ncbi:conserved hypothetical protein [Ricinus communis]|uniref:Uncharacterized protein n=1 Tax=Ricinus communis TaxID=3988 RepID=B9TIX0_RICCO|nr:conserved hypothetical protein [Ricinus communis]
MSPILAKAAEPPRPTIRVASITRRRSVWRIATRRPEAIGSASAWSTARRLQSRRRTDSQRRTAARRTIGTSRRERTMRRQRTTDVAGRRMGSTRPRDGIDVGPPTVLSVPVSAETFDKRWRRWCSMMRVPVCVQGSPTIGAAQLPCDRPSTSCPSRAAPAMLR